MKKKIEPAELTPSEREEMTWNAEGQVSKAPTAYVVKDGQYYKG